jgi:hypothetical protein
METNARQHKKDRERADNQKRKPGKALILVVTMLPQSATAMVSMVPPVMANQIAITLGLSPKVTGFYVALVYLSAVIGSAFTASLITRSGPLRTSFTERYWDGMTPHTLQYREELRKRQFGSAICLWRKQFEKAGASESPPEPGWRLSPFNVPDHCRRTLIPQDIVYRFCKHQILVFRHFSANQGRAL